MFEFFIIIGCIILHSNVFDMFEIENPCFAGHNIYIVPPPGGAVAALWRGLMSQTLGI